MTTPTWNVRDDDGLIVDDLDTFASTMGMSVKRAAAALYADPEIFVAAPLALQTEVKAFARKKPGGGTPPPIDSGSFVSWDGGHGRVDMIVTNGKVPGVIEDVEGSVKTPAARIVVYDANGKATSEKIAESTHTLKRIPPIKGSREGKASPEALVEILTEHDEIVEAKGLADHCRVTGYAVKAAYDRGLDAYPGEDVTSLTPQQWAMGRARHFVKVAALDVPRSQAGHDLDLLTDGHPLHRPAAPRGTVPVTPPAATQGHDRDEHGITMTREQVEAQMKSVRAAARGESD